MLSRCLGCHSYVCAIMLSCKMSGTLHVVFFYCEGLVIGLMHRGGERAESCKARLGFGVSFSARAFPDRKVPGQPCFGVTCFSCSHVFRCFR